MKSELLSKYLYRLKNDLKVGDVNIRHYENHFIDALISGKTKFDFLDWIYYYENEVFKESISWGSDEMIYLESIFSLICARESRIEFRLKLFEETKETSDTISNLYLIKNPKTKLYKIGVSNDIEKRIHTLRNKNGVDLILVNNVNSIKAYSLEKFMHFIYDKKRTFGEWFKLDRNDVLESNRIIELKKN